MSDESRFVTRQVLAVEAAGRLATGARNAHPELFFLGIDLGGSSIKAAVLDQNRAFLRQVQREFNAELALDPAAAVRTLTEQIAGDLGGVPCQIGLAAPGLVAADAR